MRFSSATTRHCNNSKTAIFLRERRIRSECTSAVDRPYISSSAVKSPTPAARARRFSASDILSARSTPGAHLARYRSLFVHRGRSGPDGFLSVATAPEIRPASPACNLTFKAPRYNFTLCLSYIWYRLCAFARQISGLLSETGEFFLLI